MKKNRQVSKAKIQSKNNSFVTVDSDNFNKLRISLGIIIAVFSFLLYAQSISFDYADDSVGIIKENKTVQMGISAIPVLLKSDSWEGSLWDIRGSYRPVSVIMFAIEWHFFPDNPNVNHFLNVLLYAITCWLLFLLLCKLFRNKNIIFPFVCSLLFAAHPIHTEVVNNIKSRDEILCLLFGVISILFFYRYYSKNSFVHLLLGGISFFISFASKETGIVFLVLIPLLFYFFNDFEKKKIIKIFLALLILSFIYLFLRYNILNTLVTEDAIRHMNLTFYIAQDFIKRQATAFYILLRYLLLLIFPHPLCFDYSYNQIKIQTFNDFPALAGLLVYLAMTIYAVLNIKNKNILAFALLLFLISLAPVANVFLIIGSVMAERFLYIPSLGFCMILTGFLIKFTRTSTVFREGNLIDFFKKNYRILGIVFLIVLAYSIKTFYRTPDWKDDVSLFGHDVKIAKNSARAHYQWARSLSRYQYPKEQNKERQIRILDEAIKEYKMALDIDIDYYGYRLLADCYDRKRDISNAIKYYEIAAGFNNMDRITFYNELGYLYLNTNQFDKALTILDSARKYYPYDYKPPFNKGIAYNAKGKYSAALTEFLKTIELNSSFGPAYLQAGLIYRIDKQYQVALEYFNKAAQYDPNDINPVYYMGLTYQDLGDTNNAGIFLDKAEQMRGGSK